jgi:hypothetical protein
MIGNRERLFWGALAAALLLSLLGLLPRLSAERSARSVALVVDYRDLLSLARENGETPEKMARRIGPRGIVGVLAAELSGKDLALGKLPLRFEPASAFGLGGIASDRGVIALPAASPLVPRLLEDLKAKFPDLATRTEGKTLFLLLPAAFDELGDSGLVPDYAALDFARKTGWVALYRPSPCVGVDGARTAAFLTGLFDDYPQIRALVPAGMVIAGYPDLAPVAEAMRQAGICAAQVEFVKQIGAAEFARETAPDVLPLHSLVRDEILSRRMTREQIVDRMVRAVFERSIRVVILRPYELYSGGRAAAFEADLAEIAGRSAKRATVRVAPALPGFRGAPLRSPRLRHPADRLRLDDGQPVPREGGRAARPPCRGDPRRGRPRLWGLRRPPLPRGEAPGGGGHRGRRDGGLPDRPGSAQASPRRCDPGAGGDLRRRAVGGLLLRPPSLHAAPRRLLRRQGDAAFAAAPRPPARPEERNPPGAPRGVDAAPSPLGGGDRRSRPSGGGGRGGAAERQRLLRSRLGDCLSGYAGTLPCSSAPGPRSSSSAIPA